MVRSKFSIFSFCILPSLLSAQGGDYYSNVGKIYVVVAVASIVVVGLGIFLFYLQNRISKIEKQINDDNRS